MRVVWIRNLMDETNSQPCYATLLRERTPVFEIWLVDDDCDPNKMWGDDWDDAPAFCNAGPPYEKFCKGLKKIIIRLGDKQPWVEI